jgi:hypothetical protein
MTGEPGEAPTFRWEVDIPALYLVQIEAMAALREVSMERFLSDVLAAALLDLIDNVATRGET